MKQFFLFFLALVGLTAFAETQIPDALKVVPLSGDEVIFKVAGKPEMTLNGNTLTITGSMPEDNTVAFQIENVDHVEFFYSGDVGVQSAELSLMSIAQAGRVLTINGLPAEAEIKVFAIDGRCVFATTATDSATIDFSSFPSSIYIIKINDTTFKARI